MADRFYRLMSAPLILSFFSAMAFFIVCVGVLHPGYAINDDMKIISIATGYPGVQPAPFLVYSNVLLGILLTPLYALHTVLNWEMLLFSALEFVSVWTLLYVFFSQSPPRAYSLVGALLLLACASYFALNITFTSTAALACLAGLTAILAAVSTPRASRHIRLALVGVTLSVFSSLIRIQMLYLVLPLAFTTVPFIYRVLQSKRVALALSCAGVLVLAGYTFDWLYVRAHADWNAYYFYNRIAQMLRDSHRLENTHLEIRRIAWSGNDQELFARAFFPDAGIYSVDRIQYLVEHVSAVGKNPLYTAQAFVKSLRTMQAAEFLMVCLSAWVWALAWKGRLGGWAAIPLISFVALSENLVLAWIYKDPPYVLLSLLANAAILCVLMPNWQRAELPLSGSLPQPGGFGFGAVVAAILMTGIATGIAVSQSIYTSTDNIAKQAAYARILADIGHLRDDGKISENAVIISPAYGIPVDWANPFLLNLPSFPYLDTGWSTFSPSYDEALERFGIDSLPQALYEKNNLYIMSESIFKGFLARYYSEHENIIVSFETVYFLGYPDRYAGYHAVELYKVVRSP